MARIIVPGIPHHITQRGNRRQLTFFGDDAFVERLENDLARPLNLQKRGPKPGRR